MGRYDPPRSCRRSTALTPAQYPDYAALRGDPSDNLPSRARRRGEDRRQVGRRVRQPRRAGRPRRRGQGQGRRLAARAPGRGDAQPAAHRARPRRPAAGAARTTSGCARGTATRSDQVFDTLQFRVLRDRLYATLQTAEPEADQGFDVDVDLLGPDQVAAWLAAARHREGAYGRRGWPAPGGAAPGTLTGLGLATADGAGAWLDPVALTPADDAALAAWLADPGAAQGAPRRQGPDARHGAQGWAAATGSPATPRWPPTSRCPGSARFDLSDLVAALPAPRAARRDRATTAQLSFDGSDEADAADALVVRARAVLELADVLERELEQTAAAPRCSPTSSCRWWVSSPGWSRSASRSTATTSPTSTRSSRAT